MAQDKKIRDTHKTEREREKVPNRKWGDYVKITWFKDHGDGKKGGNRCVTFLYWILSLPVLLVSVWILLVSVGYDSYWVVTLFLFLHPFRNFNNTLRTYPTSLVFFYYVLFLWLLKMDSDGLGDSVSNTGLLLNGLHV